MTRREAREMARAEAERAARLTEPQAKAPEPADEPAEPAPERAAGPAAPAPEQEAPAEASVAPEAEHASEHADFAWLHAGLHHDDGAPPRPPRRRGGGRRALTWVISVVVILALVGGGALYAWHTFQPQVQAVLAHFHSEPTDYTGDGTGTVEVTIKQGDTGETISKTLAQAGVTRTPEAFYRLLLSTKPDPVFQPGVYRLRKRMSAQSALTLLQDPKSRLDRTLLVREGDTEAAVLQNAATATGIPLAQLQAAAKQPATFGLPSQAKTLEGFLFPATYTFDPGVDATTVLKTLVDRSKQAFQDDGVPTDPNQLWRTIVLASMVQREAGPNEADLPKIAGVFTNRLARNMPLQSDATVAYGTGHYTTVFTTDAERADASNPYNTYVHTGLPPGPIGNPGDAALRAALHPEGDYLYFTTVNLKTGETAFANTQAEQDANVAKLHAWCQQPDNKSYCQ